MNTKTKIESEYKSGGYNIRLIRPALSAEERRKEDVRIVKNLRDAVLGAAACNR